jgi:hypothetical protein
MGFKMVMANLIFLGKIEETAALARAASRPPFRHASQSKTGRFESGPFELRTNGRSTTGQQVECVVALHELCIDIRRIPKLLKFMMNRAAV